MISSVKCQVCNEVVSKYRCPKCLLVYCSLSCFKDHKDNLCTVQASQIRREAKVSNEIPCVANIEEKEDGEVSEDELHGTTDKVSRDDLEKLDQSEAIREMLENPHLRRMLTEVVESDKPAVFMEKAMREPLFVEFADQCLSLVEKNIPVDT
ncbi:hypothetical protein ScPMuIL_012119 [Solemya velum]